MEQKTELNCKKTHRKYSNTWRLNKTFSGHWRNKEGIQKIPGI
jgi:hypothetical protein